MTLLDHALELAKNYGFKIFPLLPDSKIPAINDFQNSASSCPRRISEWWKDPVLGTETPFNIGISTNELVVIDIDVKPDRSGFETVIEEGYEFPSTLTTVTPSGGRHYIYRTGKPCRQGVNCLGRGIDVRSHGGYIVAPYSKTPRGTYAFLHGSVQSISEVPEWVVEKLGEPKKREVPSSEVSGTQVNQESAVARARYYLENEAPLAIEGEGGDATTFSVAARLKDFGLSWASAVAAMDLHWNPRCVPPWDSDALATKIINAYQYGKNLPGSDAPETSFKRIEEPLKKKTKKKSKAYRRILKKIEGINKEYAFVYVGGGHSILREKKDGSTEFINEMSFHAASRGRKIKVNGKQEPVTKVWMRHPERRSFLEGLAFCPGGVGLKEGQFNLWRGFSFEPIESDVKGETHDSVKMFLEHLEENVCGQNKPLARWLTGYFAHLIQRPWEKPLTALVFRGGKGVGKNALVDRIGNLFHPNYLVTADKRYLTGNFNSHLENCLLLTLDEAFWSGDKNTEGLLKALVTGTHHIIERKGKEAYKAKNITRIAVLGNEDWVIPASEDERRYAVFDVGIGRQKDIPFFTRMRVLMERGGYSYLLRYLLDFDLSQVNVNEAPLTDALREQKLESMDLLSQYWRLCLIEERVCYSDFSETWPERMDCDAFRDAFYRYQSHRGISSRKADPVGIGKKMHAFGLKTGQKVHSSDDGKWRNAYLFPSLEKSREIFEKRIGHKMEW